MIELLGGGVLGSLIGGVFRLMPEVLKLLDRKSERSHELAMFDRQCQLESQRGQQKLAEIGAQHGMVVDSGVVGAFKAAIDQQAEMVKAAGGWAAKLSAVVRPLITFWAWALYSSAFLTLLYTTWQVSNSPTDVAKAVLTTDFVALLSGITNYWFLDRTLAKRGLA